MLICDPWPWCMQTKNLDESLRHAKQDLKGLSDQWADKQKERIKKGGAAEYNFGDWPKRASSN